MVQDVVADLHRSDELEQAVRPTGQLDHRLPGRELARVVLRGQIDGVYLDVRLDLLVSAQLV